jgi:hypothetical protein
MESFFGTVKFSLPSSELFKFPPSNNPRTLPPPIPGSTLFAPPFAISPELYNDALDIRVPITIACIYAAVAVALNSYNKSTGSRPWPISQTKAFFAFVIAHNVFLALYSGWTFLGMYFALQRTLKSWSGSAGGFAATVDSLCKIHGVSGLGNAVSYDPATSQWVSQSPLTVSLTEIGTPNSTDLGRFWFEGLAFYGWFFYLSKFYEVFDTLIILAKGKRSSTLQTYHHAGAMLCMWAGIRYMSPPIWMFVFVNSFIHTLMYTYYTITAFSIRVPLALKSCLTTLQIVQFLVGSSYAALHSFISYTVPVKVPYIETVVKTAVPATTTTAATAQAFASAVGIGDLVKKYLFRAAGEEGLAQNVGVYSAEKVITTEYHLEYQTVPCVTTSGETFAIWLNVLYLAPLTALFVRFFIRSYIFPKKRIAREVTKPHPGQKKKFAPRKTEKEEQVTRERSRSPMATTVEDDVKKVAMNGHAGTNGHA